MEGKKSVDVGVSLCYCNKVSAGVVASYILYNFYELSSSEVVLR